MDLVTSEMLSGLISVPSKQKYTILGRYRGPQLRDTLEFDRFFLYWLLAYFKFKVIKVKIHNLPHGWVVSVEVNGFWQEYTGVYLAWPLFLALCAINNCMTLDL